MTADLDVELLDKLATAEKAGLPASTVNGCPCDFCTGKKKHADNWCARCANVRMSLPKWWENEDVCDQCARELAIECAAEVPAP